MNITDTQIKLLRILHSPSSAEAVLLPQLWESPNLPYPLCNIARTLSNLRSSTLVTKWQKAILLPVGKHSPLKVTSTAFWLNIITFGQLSINRRLSKSKLKSKIVRTTPASRMCSSLFTAERLSVDIEEAETKEIKLADCFN